MTKEKLKRGGELLLEIEGVRHWVESLERIIENPTHHTNELTVALATNNAPSGYWFSKKIENYNMIEIMAKHLLSEYKPKLEMLEQEWKNL